MSDSAFKAKCTKFDFGWGSAPDPAGGAYSAPPDLLAGLRGPGFAFEIYGRLRFKIVLLAYFA